MDKYHHHSHIYSDFDTPVGEAHRYNSSIYKLSLTHQRGFGLWYKLTYNSSMKKLLLLLFSLLLSFNSYGEELDSLFGISLYDNAEKYVSSDYIDSNKGETFNGYFSVYFTDEITEKNTYFSEYWIRADINNIIHSIMGAKEYAQLDRCLAVLETFVPSLEQKYETDFEYWQPTFPDSKKFEHYFYMSSGDYFGIQCNESDDHSIWMVISLDSKDYVAATFEYFDKGL